MLILHDNDTLSHQTVELLGARVIPALESPKRITKILEALQNTSHEVRTLSMDIYGTPEERAQISASIVKDHDPGYVEHLKTAHEAWVAADLITTEESILPECFQFSHRAQICGLAPVKPKDIYALAGYYAFDMSTGIMKNTFKSALASAHLAFSGVELATAHIRQREGMCHISAVSQNRNGDFHCVTQYRKSKDVMALCRPPGHHCDTKKAGGYCYFNNAVVAVEKFLDLFPGRHVGVLDIDFHHGNGTQEYFYDRSDVMYVSIHGQDEYPYYTGTEAETGVGKGEGFNLNLPLPPKSSAEQYMEKLSIGLSAMETFQSDFLIVSLGFDTYHLDPLGGFDLATDDYTKIADRIRSRLKNMPALILLEGGYVLEVLGKNLLAFLQGWEASR